MSTTDKLPTPHEASLAIIEALDLGIDFDKIRAVTIHCDNQGPHITIELSVGHSLRRSEFVADAIRRFHVVEDGDSGDPGHA